MANKPQVPIGSPRRAETGLGNPTNQSMAVVSVAGTTTLEASYPSGGDPRLRLLVRPLDGGIWVTTDGSTPVSGSNGWYMPSLEAQQFSGGDEVKCVADSTVGTGAASVCVWELGPEY